jgi:hypothetical protein
MHQVTAQSHNTKAYVSPFFVTLRIEGVTMSEPGKETDLSGVKPSRRADAPRSDPLVTLGRKRGRRARERNRKRKLQVDSSADLTRQEGSPSYRADVPVPLKFDTDVVVRPFWARLRFRLETSAYSPMAIAATVVILLTAGAVFAGAVVVAGHQWRLADGVVLPLASVLFVSPVVVYFMIGPRPRR